ncbi:MAG: hypothetical protein ACI4IQ_00195 [Eubacterium sp.]
MNNKKTALIICLFVIGFSAIVLFIGVSSHIPIVGKALALIFSVILIIFVIAVFVLAGRKNK